MRKWNGAILAALVTFVSCSVATAQDPKIKEEVTVYAEDPVYKDLRGASTTADAFSGEYATVNNLVLKKDAGTFTLQSGAVYFLKPVTGKTTGAVFIGSGEFSLTPPVDGEKKHIAIFTGGPGVKESFDSLTMFFTDDTYNEIRTSPNAQMAKGGPIADKARSLFREKEDQLRTTLRYNISARTLSDVYAPNRKGFFTSFIDGKSLGKLVFRTDPLGLPDVYPEQVELVSYSDSSGGIWTAFHLADEYNKGTATSWQDRRSYDIKGHKIDATINGTKLTVTDEITIEMREADARVLTFELFDSLRVKSVKDETNDAILFVQEKKGQDGDLSVILPKAQAVGKPFKVKVEYEGSEALREAGTGNFILIPRSTWYPNNPQSAFGDRAAFNITFRYPKKYVMVGVGERVGEEKTEGDVNVSSWSSGDVELAVAGFNYGDFKMKELKDETTGLNLEVYTNRVLPDEIRGFQQQVERAERQGAETGMTIGSLNTGGMADTVLNEAQNSTRIYSAFFGKLPYKRVAMTQQPAGFFGQAWPTLVFMPYVAFFDTTHRVQLFGVGGGTSGFWREVAAHEVAHQWWGHMVGWTSYHDQWMSEGFSEFSSSLFTLYVKKDVKKFNEFWNDLRDQIINVSPMTKGKKPFTVGPVTQGYRLNSAKTGNVARNMIYPKGAFILHMLRMLMHDRKGTGDQAFQKMMNDFLRSNYNKDVSTNDFKIAVEKHILPSMDIDKNGKMDWFFDEWVYGTELPSYKMTYSVTNTNGKAVLSGKIEQSGVSDNFVMLVPIYVDYGKGWTYLGTASLYGNKAVEMKGIQLPAEPKKVTLAAMNEVLAEKIEVVKQ